MIRSRVQVQVFNVSVPVSAYKEAAKIAREEAAKTVQALEANYPNGFPVSMIRSIINLQRTARARWRWVRRMRAIEFDAWYQQCRPARHALVTLNVILMLIILSISMYVAGPTRVIHTSDATVCIDDVQRYYDVAGTAAFCSPRTSTKRNASSGSATLASRLPSSLS